MKGGLAGEPDRGTIHLSDAMLERIRAQGWSESHIQQKTERTFELLSDISQALHKEKWDYRNTISRTVRPLAYALIKRPSDLLYDELRELLTAKPLQVDLDARITFNSFFCGEALLHRAVSYHLKPAIPLLLEAGAPIDALAPAGTVFCQSMVSKDMRELLLSHRASPVAPLDDANDHRYYHADRQSIPIFQAAHYNLPDVLALQLTQGENPQRLCLLNNQPSSFITPLYVTLFHNATDALAVLIGHGVQPDYPGEKGEVPIVRAAHHASADYCEALMDTGASLIVQNWEGETAIRHARNEVQNDHAYIHKRGKAVLERFETATAAWQAFKATGGSDATTAHDLVLFANVGKFDEAMDHRFWRGQEEHARELLHRLPPWMATQAMKHQLWLTHTEPSTEISDIELIARAMEGKTR